METSDGHTWSLALLPDKTIDEQKTIGCHWVFQLKLEPSREIDRYKTRLKIKPMVLSIDYFETFSPIIKLPMIRIILSIVVSFDWLV